MLMNNLDPEVAERPEDLVVYGGTGKAARDWAAFDAIVAALTRLGDDETLLVQSGKPVGVVLSHPDAPRVLIANSNLVGNWATWDHFHELERKGLMMYGQMTAGSWIYIGSQGILQGTFETLAELARQHFDGDLKGKLVLTGGLGGMGGAQPLAVTMNGGVALVAEVDEQRIRRRLETRYCDELITDLDEAIERCLEAKQAGQALSVGLLGNAADIFPALLEKDVIPDVVTDQTSAHDELNGYVPHSLPYAEAQKLRGSDPEEYKRRAFHSMAVQVKAMLTFQERGAIVFDYGNNIRAQAETQGVNNAFDFPGFVPAYIRPMFCEGKGPFRWAALSGDPADILATDEKLIELFPEDKSLHRWLRMAQEQVQFQGLPCRICWLGYGERHVAGLEFNRMVRDGELSAPIVLGRDHLDCGSVASPNRETEAMKDGTDAVADWPLLNGMLAVAGGASWVSMHHGGGVGIGYSQHSGQVCVCDGTPEMDERLRAVLTNDPGMGVVRHVDAGYELAEQCRRERGVDLP